MAPVRRTVPIAAERSILKLLPQRLMSWSVSILETPSSYRGEHKVRGKHYENIFNITGTIMLSNVTVQLV